MPTAGARPCSSASGAYVCIQTAKEGEWNSVRKIVGLDYNINILY